MRSVARAVAGSRLVTRWLGLASRRGAILSYHGVVADGATVAPLHATVGQLAAQLEAMASLGLRFVPLDEMLARLRAGRSVARCVAVTFDDAYAGLQLALPVLQRLAVPATVFVPTGYVESGAAFWWDRIEHLLRARSPEAGAEWAARLVGGSVTPGDERRRVREHVMSEGRGRLTPAMERAFAGFDERPPAVERPMDWPALARWLAWEGATCAPHTVTHPVLPLLSEDEQRREIADSHRRLCEQLPRVLPVIAYPYGLYDAATLRAAHAAGMTDGVTMDRVGCAPGESDPLRVPRLPFGGATPVARMGLYLSAPWRWYRRRNDWHGGYPALPARPAAR